MPADNLDRFFQEKLGELDSAKPSAADWLAAKSMVVGQKKRDRNLLLWLCLLGIFNVVFTYYTWSSGTSVSTHFIPPEKNEPPAMASNDFMTTGDQALGQHEDNREGASAFDRQIGAVDNQREEKQVGQADQTVKSSTPGGVATSNISSEVQTIISHGPDPSLTNNQGNEADAEASEQDVATSENEGASDRIVRHPQVQLEGLPTIRLTLDYVYPMIQGSAKPDGFGGVVATATYRRNRYGGTGSLLLNPHSQVLEPLRGLQLGFLAEFYLGKHIFLGLRPSLQITVNENGFSKFQIQTSYSFSAINETFGLRASSLQFMSIPAYLGFEFKKHTLELGAGIDWLFAARGQLQQVEFEDDDFALVNAFSSGWIDTDEMRRFSHNLFAGYKYAINQYVKVGMTLIHNPNNLYPSLEPGQVNNLSRWAMGLQINYYSK